MAALLGATPEQAEDACTAAPDGCWVANDNAPGQVVIAGTPDGLAAGSARAQEIGVRRVTPLNVGGAFHTPLMADATAGLLGGGAGRRPSSGVRVGRGLGELGASGREAHAVVEREHARGDERGDLPERVTRERDDLVARGAERVPHDQ